MIAFVGSVFSPYYAWSGRADPHNHCAINLALYEPGRKRWAMTERGRKCLVRDAHSLAVGPSSFCWDGGVLTIAFDEITAPMPSRIRGTIRVHPSVMLASSFALDSQGRHLWRPMAPRAEVEVNLENPSASWRGTGYLDSNSGDGPLEEAFSDWDWSRAHLARDTLLFYDVTGRDGVPANLAMRVSATGDIETLVPPPRVALPPTAWRVNRRIRNDLAEPPRLRRTLEDTPFYARSVFDARLGGEVADVIHESLSLDRFRHPVVQAMLPFRMPRRFW